VSLTDYLRNGHVMTHNAKKPYECRYRGCDKSYCDSRSLRRHLENQHQQFFESSSSACSDLSPSILSPGGGLDSPNVFRFELVYPKLQGLCGESSGIGERREISPVSPLVDVASIEALTTSQGQGRRWPSGYSPLELVIFWMVKFASSVNYLLAYLSK